MNCLFQLRRACVVLLLVTVSFVTKAQTKPESPVGPEGFWVIETPPKGHQCIVRFYTNDQKLIYQETVNRCLNIARRQTKRQLTIALDQALFVWNATHQIPTDRQWVAVRFDKK